MVKLEKIDLGKTPYLEVYAYQKQLLSAVYQGATEKIIICSHPPVVTLGRQTTPEDIQGWTGEIVEIERGGRATYHGPNQVILYPIINLKKRNNDIHLYVRHLEEAVIRTLADYKIEAVGNPDGTAKTTGVWVGDKKIASIGIAVKHWVTYHGIALNVLHDPQAFSGINPCGFTANTMTSLEQLLGHSVDYSEVKSKFASYAQTILSQSIVDRA
jgi:lipoate-protein ligase B